MANDLRELRLRCQLPAKDLVAVVQEIYPKYDKTMQSKCERGSEYGVDLRPDAMEALYLRFDPGALTAQRKKKNSCHRLTCRISCRLEDEDYRALQQHIKADGYATMQDWLSDIVRRYLKEKENLKCTSRIIP